MKLTCSIAMCTYNGKKYIQEQLESLVTQTRLPDELVVCDDCSTDNTVQIVTDFAKTAPFPVRIFQNEKNIGHIKNFAKCATICEKDIVFFCDQDDIWLPHKISEFLSVFESNTKVGIVVSSIIPFKDTAQGREPHVLNKKNYLEYPRIVAKLIKKGRFHQIASHHYTWVGHAIGYRREYNDFLYPVPEHTDYDCWCFIALNIIAQCVVIEKASVLHRNHTESVAQKLHQNQIQSQSHGSRINNEIISMGFWEISQAALLTYERIAQHSNSSLVNNKALQALKNRSDHYLRRIEARKYLFNRIRYSFCELLNGNYFYYSSGILSFGKDLLGR